MRSRGVTALGVGAVLFVVAGCGGGGAGATATQGGLGATASPAATSNAGGSSAAASSVPSTAASPAASSGGGGGGGGAAAGVCSLVTVAELQTIMGGTGAITESVIAGPPDTCDVHQNDAPVAAWVYTPQGAKVIFDALAGASGNQQLSGYADAAFYDPNQDYLVIRKGDAMLSISVHDVSKDADTQHQMQLQIGKVAAGRM